RWAQHWLDIVRFGESTGFEVNRDRENAYFYRDYVIDALNADKSYRDFVIEQLAGDAIGVDAATGFLVAGPSDLVKSPDINLTLMQREDELADFVNTTGTAFLGLTVGCARCHNHKFDPIIQKDYYALQAVFAGVQHGERALRERVSDATRNRIADLEHELHVAETAWESRRRLAESATIPAVAEDELLPPVNPRSNVEEFDPVAAKFVRFAIRATTASEPCIDELEIFSADGRNVALASSGAVPSASGTLPNYDIHRLEHVNDGRFGNSHSWISNTNGTGWVQIEFPQVEEICRIGWGRDREGVFSDRLATDYMIDVAVTLGQWQTVASSAKRQPYQQQSPSEDAFIASLSGEEAIGARRAYDELKQLREQLQIAKGELPVGYVGTFTDPPKIRRLYRGDPLAPREEVGPDALSVIGTLELPENASDQERRLALAKWIASPSNPLTARVIVNRVWHYHFGTGIVATPSDFGRNGAPPSHPELLDYLASQFIANGWSLKWLHREILSSHTYQQSGTPRSDAMRKDAGCRLLWRFPPRRLEAEAIRDCVLFATGALNLKAGGPGFSLFRIDHENVHHYFPLEEFGPNEFRRMIYALKIRQERDDVFGVFDCPDGGQVMPNRSRSTTPLQALNLLNSPFMLQQSSLLADRIRNEAEVDDLPRQVQRAFRCTLLRNPDPDESLTAAELCQQHGLDALCRALLNSNEFLFLP
ncbi:MAG: DUF1553 domain-containing protein, partial [Planctomycetales bacterium]|nr:DUF1553 domain-containing protein [Planctomycetales bacterium]